MFLSKHHNFLLPSAESVSESRRSCLHTLLSPLERDHQENLINSHKLCHRQALKFLPGLFLTMLPSQAMQHDHGERQRVAEAWLSPGVIDISSGSYAYIHTHTHKHTLHDTSPGGVIGPYHVIKAQEAMRGWWQRAGLTHRRWPILLIFSLTTYNGDNTRSTSNTMLSHPWGSPC